MDARGGIVVLAHLFHKEAAKDVWRKRCREGGREIDKRERGRENKRGREIERWREGEK